MSQNISTGPRPSLAERLINLLGIEHDLPLQANVGAVVSRLAIIGFVAFCADRIVEDNITNVSDAKVRSYESEVGSLREFRTGVEDRDHELRSVKLSPDQKARIAESKERLKAELKTIEQELDSPNP